MLAHPNATEVLSSMVGSLLLALLFVWFYRREGDRATLVLAGAFTVSAARLAFVAVTGLSSGTLRDAVMPTLFIAETAIMFVGVQLLDRKPPRFKVVLAGAGLACAWFLIGASRGQWGIEFQGPLFWTGTLLLIVAGLGVFRSGIDRFERSVAAVGLVGSGVMQGLYPFAIAGIAFVSVLPWGYLALQTLKLTMGGGIIMLYLRQLRRSRDRSEAWFDQLARHSSDLFMLVTPTKSGATVTRANRALTEALGGKHGEFQGQAIADIFHDPNEAGAFLTQLDASPHWEGSTTWKAANGDLVPVEVTATVVDSGPSPSFMIVARDQRARLEALARIARLSSILEASSDVVTVSRRDGSLLYANAMARRMLGAPEVGDLPGGLALEDLFETEAAFILGEGVDAARAGTPWTQATTLKGVDGTAIAASTLVMTGEGWDLPGGFVATISRDVRELRELERKLSATQRLGAIGTLAGGLAHDVNNLLTVVGGSAEAISRLHADHEETGWHLERIREAWERGAALMEQILTFARRDVGPPEVFNLVDLVERMETLVGRLVGGRVEVRVETSLRRDHRVKLSRSRAEQIVMNLAVNAAEAMPGGGTMTIRVGGTALESPEIFDSGRVGAGTYAVLSLADTGQGIAPDVLRHIFEPFYTTKGSSGGSGLGLATVHGIVTEAGGGIRIDTEPGEGTTVHVYLPETDEALTAQDAFPDDHAAPPLEARILLVDDDPSVLLLLAAGLEHAGYQVLRAESGQAALDRLADDPGEVDLLVTDVMLPGLSGPRLVEHVREARPDLRVLFMSGYAEGGLDIPKGDTRTHFLQKPFTSNELTRQIGMLLRTS